MGNSINIAHASSGDDTNEKEIGIEWVNDYHGRASYLPYSDDSAKGFLKHLVSKGFTKSFEKGNDNAWEKHFESPSVGGSDYVDKYADFVFFQDTEAMNLLFTLEIIATETVFINTSVTIQKQSGVMKTWNGYFSMHAYALNRGGLTP